ncbi:DUF7315 family membrane protein [Halococcus saccharolyticus]|uniref:DUF7315 domain-containing protein n=1 Tax=Halococcus saccharolyticus DSM 5350 TaxID=1227455 RepID=M0MKI7_9EURY|nr:hypothetical protein [Halococcus saccharolyticus]EMA46171.1 hypothetical protein C449_05682 [Halococcus saccharolyticus DSM 5350]
MGSDTGSGSEADGSDGGNRGREIVVPLRTYKAVTVFSTLVAIVCVLLGFAFLDAATAEAGPLPVLFDLLPSVGLPVGSDVVSLVLVLIGLALIGLGAGVYVLGTRFRTTGMRNAQDDSDEPSGNE